MKELAEFFGLLVIPLMLVASIGELNRQHSPEIYAIWYVFSFFFLLFFALYLFAEWEGKEVTDVLGPSSAETLKVVYNYLTNIGDEFLLVAAVVYLAIAPQLLTYVLSGLSGSAIPPAFVRQIRTIAIWSLIKFLAGLSGILLAHAFAKLVLGKAARFDFLQGVVIIAIAFFFAGMQHELFEREFEFLLPGLRVHISVPWLLRVHAYFTRHTRQPARAEPGFVRPLALWRYRRVCLMAAERSSEPSEAPERELQLDVLGLLIVHLRGPVALAALDLLTRLNVLPASSSVAETQALGAINDDRSVPWTMFNDDVQMGLFDVYDQYLASVTKPDQQPPTDQNRAATVGGETDESSR